MLRNITSISSFVSKSLIRIIPKQVIVLFDKTCFHNSEAGAYPGGRLEARAST